MSLQNALGIKSSQLKEDETKQSKKTNDCKETLNCREQMKITESLHSKKIRVNHFVKVKDKKSGEIRYKLKTSFVQGNITKHPTNKDLKVVEVLHVYKETIESDDTNIKILD